MLDQALPDPTYGTQTTLEAGRSENLGYPGKIESFEAIAKPERVGMSRELEVSRRILLHSRLDEQALRILVSDRGDTSKVSGIQIRHPYPLRRMIYRILAEREADAARLQVWLLARMSRLVMDQQPEAAFVTKHVASWSKSSSRIGD